MLRRSAVSENKYRILSLEDSGKFVVCADSIPIASGDTVELCKEYVFQYDLACDPSKWFHAPPSSPQDVAKWINVTRMGKVWTIYPLKQIV